MNRAQRRAMRQGKTKRPDLNDPAQAQKMLEELPVATLVSVINNILDILQKRCAGPRRLTQRARSTARRRRFGRVRGTVGMWEAGKC